MAKKFNDLLNQMPPKRQKNITTQANALLLEMALQDLRKSRNLTQKDLAKSLEVNQSALSKIEHQQDINVSTLRNIVQAMGGSLKLVATFPDNEVVINQFEKTL
jgi:transcriptional regulator with XRE-family HTH domain